MKNRITQPDAQKKQPTEIEQLNEIAADLNLAEKFELALKLEAWAASLRKECASSSIYNATAGWNENADTELPGSISDLDVGEMSELIAIMEKKLQVLKRRQCELCGHSICDEEPSNKSGRSKGFFQIRISQRDRDELREITDAFDIDLRTFIFHAINCKIIEDREMLKTAKSHNLRPRELINLAGFNASQN